MSTATGTEILPVAPFQAEWHILRGRQPNLLLVGSSAGTITALRLLQRYIRTPTVTRHARMPLEFPGDEARTLILRDVDALSATDQERLLAWIGNEGSRTQIVSTTECHLFGHVASGRFNETLVLSLERAAGARRIDAVPRPTCAHAHHRPAPVGRRSTYVC